MVTLTSRILTIGLALYSFLEVRATTPQNVPHAPAGIAAQVLFAVQLLTGFRQALSSSPRDAAHVIVAIVPWLTGGLLVSETAIVFYYLRRFDAASNSQTTDN